MFEAVLWALTTIQEAAGNGRICSSSDTILGMPFKEEDVMRD